MTLDTPPSEQNPISASSDTVSAADIAADTIRESEGAVMRPLDVNTVVEPTAPIDAWGRAFDPTLHLAKRDGTPALSPSGKLYSLKGKGLGKIKFRKKPIVFETHTGDHLDLDNLHNTSDESQTKQATKTEAAQIDFTEKFSADAKTITEGIEALRMLLVGERGTLDPVETARLESRWTRALTENGITLPIGSLFLALFDSGRSVYKVSVTPEGKSTWANWIDWVNGRKKKEPEGKPLNKPADQPHQSEEPPKVVPQEPKIERLTTEHFL